MGIVTADISVSLDLVAAGHDQSAEHPFGRTPRADGSGGTQLHDIGDLLHTWMFEHRDDHLEEVEAITAAGAFVMGRHMFGPDRGEWDLDWTGWWGEDPPYHAPVFVLGHRPRASVEMAGGTTFHFVTDGVEAAVARAREAAGGRDVSIAGGATTLNACLRAGLVDELRLHVAPITLGDGVRVFDDAPGLTLVPASARATPHVTHLVLRRP